jgi:hypothetical protein
MFIKRQCLPYQLRNILERMNYTNGAHGRKKEMSAHYENLVNLTLLRPWTHYSTSVDMGNTMIV